MSEMFDMKPEVMIFLTCVGLLTAAAAAFDFRIKKIPNKLTLPIFVAGLIYKTWFFGWGGKILVPGLVDSLAAFVCGFGLFYVMWMTGSGGGGDAKLMGALSVWIGFKLTWYVMVVSTIFVILGTIVVMTWQVLTHGLFRTKETYLTTDKTPKGQSPVAETAGQRQSRRVMGYAPPVALATWLIVLFKLHQFPNF